MRVVISQEARADLRAIGRYIAQDSRSRAISFVRELRGSCLGLRTLPRGWPLVEAYAAEGLRKRVHGAYLIFFVAVDDRVEILNVIHASRDYDALLAARLARGPNSDSDL